MIKTIQLILNKAAQELSDLIILIDLMASYAQSQ
jgi:hypothetical protein